MHYADDATIVIKQNRCCKEVVKEIQDYEEASGAKINYEKNKRSMARELEKPRRRTLRDNMD